MDVRPLALAALLLPLAACEKNAPAPPATTTTGSAVTVTYTGTDYGFAGPDTVTAGLVTVRLVNGGKEAHQIGIVRVDSGKGLADIATAMAGTAVPAWMTFVGGANTAAPGDTSSATQALAPGRYLPGCLLPPPDGKMHLQKGM